MCKFYHFRNVEDKETGSTHVKGGFTVAFEVDGNYVKFAIAACSPKDNFCRRTGRQISEGRLKSGKHAHLVLEENQSPFEAFLEIVK